ncbi:hypothetical protein F7725_004340 [Dissostichus mawsoni]|uniref:Uncharacterized protein n=1 Tax=Dissostichus mawsoni TaxID=36200 RepID=A0A7J5XIE7_DISMA|nr:hypothetical protein F7725_004340 [Dissostichus mawsoni]
MPDLTRLTGMMDTTKKTNLIEVQHQCGRPSASVGATSGGRLCELSCSVYATECEGEQSLYWFRDMVRLSLQSCIPVLDSCEHILKEGTVMRIAL